MEVIDATGLTYWLLLSYFIGNLAWKNSAGLFVKKLFLGVSLILAIRIVVYLIEFILYTTLE